jgi:hypothetical protein
VLENERVLCALNMSVMVDTVCRLGVSSKTVQKLNLFPLSGINVPNQLSPLGTSSRDHWTLKVVLTRSYTLLTSEVIHERNIHVPKCCV